MRVLTLTTPDMENGFGCRVTIWFAGCSHHCSGCHNRHTWDYNQGQPLFDKEVIKKIYKEVDKNFIKGITLSGGDPLSQSDESLKELLDFLKTFKKMFPNKDIWIYNGGLYESDMNHKNKKEIIQLCDVMVDGPFIKELFDPDLSFRGSSNQRIIDIKKSIESNKVVEIEIK